ncbi:MAG: hypothetical protein EAZ61_00300 [Oscillatoriales cyanobacterium]|nr:MAG: hypothetical protein EAZ61_00300 [Oscillatoriales cyanobacterium]
MTGGGLGRRNWTGRTGGSRSIRRILRYHHRLERWCGTTRRKHHQQSKSPKTARSRLPVVAAFRGQTPLGGEDREGSTHDVSSERAIGVHPNAPRWTIVRKLPDIYQQFAFAHTNFWTDCGVVLPSKRHRAVGKETDKTSYIKRGNTTLRQGFSHLVRETSSFSTSLENHIGAIWYFIHHHNASSPSWHYRLVH